MTSYLLRARPLGMAALLASSVLAGLPVLAAEAAASSGVTDVSEVIVTAQKREENIQKVPMSIQALDNKKLSQLNITNFQDYVKFMPSVTFQTLAPNQTSVYMRGVASGDNANHSGPLPSVGTYLDEQPITTIGGTLDVHIYDIARVEVLPGPQGTLYGASSQSGTMKIITNKPSTAGFSAGYDLQGNLVKHGSFGGVAEGFVNIPVAANVAIRLVGFAEHDSGFIDNVLGTRPFKTSGVTINNAPLVEKHFNHVDSFGGRAALKFDLNDSWTVIPTLVAEETKTKGVFGFNPQVGDLQVQRFQPDTTKDRWAQAALNVTGKIGRFDLNYSGGYFQRKLEAQSDYTDYSVAYDQAFGSGNYWRDSTGTPLAKPQQEIAGRDRFTKESNELRISSPNGDRFRLIAGLYQAHQTHLIIQDYQIAGFDPALSVPGHPGTIWLTRQSRVDRDQAVFAEATFDITDKISITAGVRGYHYHNTLYGFYGYGAGYNALTGFHSGQGVGGINCQAGKTFTDTPCVNLDKGISGSGETHKVNLTYKFDNNHLVYFTYSTGYRPGGVNRSGAFLPYQSDTLTNFELGWKTSWAQHRVHFNGAIYDEEWDKFQFSFLGPNSLTIVENAPQARIRGVETSLDWRASKNFTLSGGAAYNHGRLVKNFCGTDANAVVIPTCADIDAVALHGQQLPYTPSFKGNLTARFTFDLAGWDGHFQVSGLYQNQNGIGLRKGDLIFLTPIPGFASADFSLGAERGNLSLEMFVKNAFDTRGGLNRSTPCTVAVCAQSYPGVPAALYIVPIQPLTIGVKVGQKF